MQMREFFPFTTLIHLLTSYPLHVAVIMQSGTITKKTEMQCNSAMPDFIIAGEKVDNQEVPESYPEHPFDRGFHFPSCY